MLRILIIASILLFSSAKVLLPGDIQWASEVLGYSSELSRPAYSAEQILGEPSVMPRFGSTPCAWTPHVQRNARDEWIIVKFDSAIHVRQIIIAENLKPGCVYRILLYDTSGKQHKVWARPPQPAKQSHGRFNNIFIGRTPYKVSAAKLFLNTGMIKGYTQIDAIAIADFADPVKPRINYSEKNMIREKPENLGKNINSPFSEVAPVITPDGKTLFYTRSGHPDNMGSEQDQDVWFSEIDENQNCSPAKNLGFPINNLRNNFAISVTPDGNSMLVGNIYDPKVTEKQGVSISYFGGEEWSYPSLLRIKDFYNENKYSSYCLGSDGKTLLMTVEREGTYGELDMYVSFMQDNDSWSEPMNLGPDLNTADVEATPFLASDGVTMYFSSAGHPGFGNQDIFITRRLDSTWRKWSKPENLGPVLNTSGWDAYFTIPASGDYAYIVSTKNSYGKEDIFRLPLPEELRPKPVALISGRVLNSKTHKPLDAKIIYETLPDGKEAGIARSNPKTGAYKIVLPGGAKYGFLAQADSFIAVNENLDLRKIKKYTEIKRDLYLVPIEHGQKVKLNNIFFEFGKWELLEDSHSELNRVAEFLRRNPGIDIEVQGHTDNVGSAGFNINLSRKRASSVAGYLTSKGIDEGRIQTRGFGQSKPIAPNNNDENRQKNRRVEFVIKTE